MTVILGTPEWECPNCMTVHKGVPVPGQPFLHDCPGLHGLTAPLVPKGQKCKVEAQKWEDYVRHDFAVRKDGEGQPMSSVNVTRDDGNDVIAFPSAAVVEMEF